WSSGRIVATSSANRACSFRSASLRSSDMPGPNSTSIDGDKRIRERLRFSLDAPDQGDAREWDLRVERVHRIPKRIHVRDAADRHDHAGAGEGSRTAHDSKRQEPKNLGRHTCDVEHHRRLHESVLRAAKIEVLDEADAGFARIELISARETCCGKPLVDVP